MEERKGFNVDERNSMVDDLVKFISPKGEGSQNIRSTLQSCGELIKASPGRFIQNVLSELAESSTPSDIMHASIKGYMLGAAVVAFAADNPQVFAQLLVQIEPEAVPPRREEPRPKFVIVPGNEEIH